MALAIRVAAGTAGCAQAPAQPRTLNSPDTQTHTATPTPTQTTVGYPPDDGKCWGVLGDTRGMTSPMTPAGQPCPPGMGRSGEEPTPLEDGGMTLNYGDGDSITISP